MRYQSHAEYTASAIEVFEIMHDLAFQEERVDRTSTLGGTASITDNAGGTVITTMRAFASDVLPDYARGFVGSRLEIVESQFWMPDEGDGTRTGRLELHISGQPLTLRADIALYLTDDGCATTIQGLLRARVPFIGRKIETAASPLIHSGAEAEAALINEWLHH